MNYQNWLKYRSGLQKRDISQDEHDYDLESYYNSLKYNPNEESSDMHLPDTYKKPNHPTFSSQSIYNIPGIQEGGQWIENEDKKWSFTPSDLNLRNMSAEQMVDYFSKADPNAELNLSKKFNKIKSKLRNGF